jgi:hypothetical protein
VEPRDEELLTGMGNCYAACGADFESTVEMVAGARRLNPEEVRRRLERLREEHGHEPEYRTLRARLPDSFPL